MSQAEAFALEKLLVPWKGETHPLMGELPEHVQLEVRQSVKDRESTGIGRCDKGVFVLVTAGQGPVLCWASWKPDRHNLLQKEGGSTPAGHARDRARQGDFDDLPAKGPVIVRPCLTLVHGTAETCPDRIAPASIDCVFTSPPYFEAGGYSAATMVDLGRATALLLKPGGRLWVDFGQVQEDFSRLAEVQNAILHGSSGALEQWQTVVWVKSIAVGKTTFGHFKPINSKHLLNYTHEVIFQFIRGVPKKAPALDRLAVGVPFMDKSNLGRGTRGKNGDVRCAGDTWFIPYKTTGAKKKKAHPHSFPVALPTRAFKVSGMKPGMTVLDPFMGGGTTSIAALRMGLNVVGVDPSQDALAVTLRRWRAAGGLHEDLAPGAFPAPPPSRLMTEALRPGVYLVKRT